ncbi:MAG: aminoacyl-histidine dipeptidase [Methanocorpusculum parvum]|nr:aminoacyl-histidine dipeptidase [Methanocorpusculum parvum]
MPSALEYFEEIAKIPRPSGHEEKIREYLKEFAKANSFACIEDESGNIIIRRGDPKVTLQGHMDMVPESVSPFDFETCGIKTCVKDGWICADGTTLGADNGAGVALMLSALTAPKLSDIPLECLFTVDEEVGMTGVEALASDVLKGNTLINLDHEDGNSLLVGCAGGVNTEAVFPKIRTLPKGEWYTLKISGLASGHSGIDIGLGRVNAVKLAADFMTRVNAEQVSAFSSGTKCNVIPKEAEVTFSTDSDAVESVFAAYADEVRERYAAADPAVSMSLEKTDEPAAAYDGYFVHALHECRNGVVEEDARGVLTSSNLAAVVDEADAFRIITLQRSAVNTSRDALSAEIAFVFREAGADVFTHSSFSGWLLAENSALVLRAAEVYEQMFGRKLEIETTHGGVECGMIQEKYPEMEIISLGPTIEGCHTVNERMSIQSLEETERFLSALILELWN